MLKWIACILGTLLAIATPFAASAQPSQPESRHWVREGERMVFTTARISLPARAGATSLSRSSEFSHPGEGIDTALQYLSDDQTVFATVYVYYPGLPHAGLTAFATDWAIRTQSSEALRQLASTSVSTGSREAAAIRIDYSGYRDGLATSAAFIRAGRWIVKLRVSGPEDRRAEVVSAMTALLAGIRFEGEAQPDPATPLDVGSCEGASTARARPLADEAVQAAVDAMISMLDRAVEERGGRQVPVTLPDRFGSRWCLSTRARIGQSTYEILRSANAGERALSGRTVAFVSINDAGSVLELVESHDRRVVLLFHDIGRTAVLGAFETVPNDEQIAAVISGSDRESGRFRATVRRRPGEGDTINVTVPPSSSAPTT